jgi:hypothetical protein
MRRIPLTLAALLLAAVAFAGVTSVARLFEEEG